jgi:hypothetical protein
MPHRDAAWTRLELIAGFWVGRVLGQHGADVKVARDSYLELPLGGRIGVAELRGAEEALQVIGLAALRDGRLIPDDRLVQACRLVEPEGCELLLALILEVEQPLWLRTAAGDGEHVRSEFLPDGVEAALATIIEDPDRREAFLLARARKVNADERQRIGELGEIAVLEACRQQLTDAGAVALATEVQRVSMISDELGYDITAPRCDRSPRRIEVKTTRAAGSIAPVIITRTEASVGSSDPAWMLLVVRLSDEESAQIVGWLDGQQITPHLPVNQGSTARWETASLRLPVTALIPGLPPC